VPKKLKELNQNGFKIVIFTNQAGVAIGKTKVQHLKTKFNAILELAGVPMSFMASFDKTSKYRKPSSGMWDHFVSEECAGKIDMEKSFYCGDAAGRIHPTNSKLSDFSSDDALFGLNVGAPFCTPEMFFLNQSLNFKPPMGVKVFGSQPEKDLAEEQKKNADSSHNKDMLAFESLGKPKE
jgi:bifunctional polynucleotide phosphatase/kinase